MDPIEEYLHKEKLVDKETEIAQHIWQDLLELHDKYPYIKIDDLTSIYFIGFGRTLQEMKNKEE